MWDCVSRGRDAVARCHPRPWLSCVPRGRHCRFVVAPRSLAKSGLVHSSLYLRTWQQQAGETHLTEAASLPVHTLLTTPAVPLCRSTAQIYSCSLGVSCSVFSCEEQRQAQHSHEGTLERMTPTQRGADSAIPSPARLCLSHVKPVNSSSSQWAGTRETLQDAAHYRRQVGALYPFDC